MRENNRAHDQLRPISIQCDQQGYADATILFELGRTKVQASVTLQQGVPPFLKGQGVGWLTAEYAMLPTATHQRTKRESSMAQKNSRNIEISRLIGRSLRTTVDLDSLGEKTIIIDCDVLQADGGTRVSAITAASLALKHACKRWFAQGQTKANIYLTPIAAISAGIVGDDVIVDLTYNEDSNADADFNFVMNTDNNIIEIQGTAEKTPISWQQFELLRIYAQQSIQQLFTECAKITMPELERRLQPATKQLARKREHAQKKPAFFSLGNRMAK
ncbi:MAG: ribonuclease PH [Epsilonproteobacteria bacterium]|nr:ribonuclease PH [Campylobacterota bacterium]